MDDTEDKSQELQELLQETVSALGGTNNTYTELLKFLSEEDKLSIPSRVLPGQLLFFKYEPTGENYARGNKYYDVFPLLLVTEVHRGGFEGINIHFLDDVRREFLFTNLLEDLQTIKSEKEWKTRLSVNYRKLKGGKKFSFFAPCYREYVWKGMRKRPIVVPFEYWNMMAKMNLGFFVNARRPTVYRNSRKIIRRNNKKT